MNVIDITIVVAFIAIIAAGFFAGFARVLSAMVSIYFATVIAATFYTRLGDVMRDIVPQMSKGASQLLAFTVLFIGVTAGLSYVIHRTLNPTEGEPRLSMVSSMGGATLSIVGAAVALTLAMAVIAVLVQAVLQTSLSDGAGTMSNFRAQVRASELAPIFLKLLPFVATAVRPWFPGGLPPILTEVEI